MSHFCRAILLVAAALGARADTPFNNAKAPWARTSLQLFLGATSPPPPSLCTDACMFASEDHWDDCDDGGAPGSEFPMCAYCTDCADYSRGQPPVASSAPLRAVTGICTKTCFYASESDGGPGSEFPMCAYNNDCVDYEGRPPPSPHSAGTNNCLNTGGSSCNDGGGPGSDFATYAHSTECVDCGPRVSMPSSPPRSLAAHPARNPPPSSCSNLCFTSNADDDDGGPGSERLFCAARAVVSTKHADMFTRRAGTSTSHAVASYTSAGMGTIHAAIGNVRAVMSIPRTVVSADRAVVGILRAVTSTSHAVMIAHRAEHNARHHKHHMRRRKHKSRRRENFRSPAPSMPPPKTPQCRSDSGLLDGSSILIPRQLVCWGCLLMASLMALHLCFANSPCSRPPRPREKQGVHGALTLLAWCTMLPHTEASDVPRLYRGLQLEVPSHRRELYTTQVSTSAGLTSALANTAVSRIVLASGTYNLTSELSITRSVVLEAAVAGLVTLNAQASSSSQRRVLSINPGSSGVVQLIGLSITGGYNSDVRAHSKFPIAPMEFSHILRVRLQGGGVYVYRGSVTFSSCTITDNSAYDVRDHAQKFPSPRWENCSRTCFDSRVHNCE